jgi:hypothetical protein
MLPLFEAATTIMEKPGEHAIPAQLFTPAFVQADQLAPPSREKYM